MRRVLILIKGLGRGGAEQIIASSVPYLAHDRFSYEIAYIRPDRDALVEHLRDAGITVTCIGDGNMWSWIPRLRDLLRRRRIDLIHAHLPMTAVGARIVKGATPLVYTEHNMWRSYLPVTRWANQITYARNDAVFAVSDEVRRSIVYPLALRWRRMPRVETLHHGVDLEAVKRGGVPDGVRDELQIPPGAPVAVTVGNFRREKGHHDLVKAIRIVRRTVPDARFVLVGQGPLEDEVRRTVDEVGVADRVVFAGFRTDVPRIVAASDVFVLPSRFEGLPISLVEAMAVGKPSVVTDVGGVREVVTDDAEALVVPAKDPSALAAGVVSLLTDPPLRARLASAAARRAEAFDIRRSVARIEAVYEELLS